MPSPASPSSVSGLPRSALASLLFFRCLWIFCLLIPPFSGRVQAAEPRGEAPYALIFGTVWGPDNRPVYGVNVKIRRADQKKRHWELQSDHHGEFAQRVPAGKADYIVWADLKGYKGPDGKKLVAGPEVTVHVENDERVDTGVHLK